MVITSLLAESCDSPGYHMVRDRECASPYNAARIWSSHPTLIVQIKSSPQHRDYMSTQEPWGGTYSNHFQTVARLSPCMCSLKHLRTHGL